MLPKVGAQTLLCHRQFKEHWTDVRVGRGECGARIGRDWAHVRLKEKSGIELGLRWGGGDHHLRLTDLQVMGYR